jgi:UDP-N-acetylglucosamine 1-carboxyvinyltransferase
VIAALAAEGISEVYDIHYIERGYEDFPEKLRRLGAEIETIDSELEKRKFQFKVG